MRALTPNEMDQVSGGFFLFSLFSCKPKVTTCSPKPSKPSCQPKPKCEPKPRCEPKPPCGPVEEIPL